MSSQMGIKQEEEMLGGVGFYDFLKRAMPPKPATCSNALLIGDREEVVD